MYVEEDIGRKVTKIQVSDWQKAYFEFKDLLENRYQFMQVEEKKFFHHKDRGTVYSFVAAHRDMDDFTRILFEIEFEVKIGSDRKSAEIVMDSRAVIVTEYPEETSFQESLIYYAARSVWDKLVYGWSRGKWKKQGDELLNDIHSQLVGMVSVV